MLLRGKLTKLVVTITLLVSTTVSWCGNTGGSGLPKVRVTTLPHLSHAPLFIAKEEGFFEEQGVDVEFVTFRRTASALPALVQGDLDAFLGMISPSYLNAILRVGAVRVVVVRGTLASVGCEGYGLVARRALVENGSLRGPESLKGLRIGTDRTSTNYYTIDTLLSSAGLTLDDIETVQIPPALKVEAFRRNLLDVATSSEPWMTRILDTGDAVMWMPTRRLLPGFQFGFILFGPTLLEKDREAGRRFVTAYLKGVRQYNRDGKSDRNLTIVAKNLRLEIDLLKRTCWPYHQMDGRLHFERMQDYQTWAVQKGFIERPLEERELWDQSFVEHANRVLDGLE